MAKKVVFDKKNVLVTGGAGFIGSHLCDELVKTSKVICIDNFITSSEINIDHLLFDENFEFINHDITQPIELENMPELQKFKIEFQGIQEIYHLACPMSPKKFYKNRMDTILANSLGTKNMLDQAVKYNSKFMLFSSSVVYGPKTVENKPKKESDLGTVDTISERSSYDESKRFAETIVDTYKRDFKLKAKIARVFRTYGPRMTMGDGQMIPDFINNALDNKDLVIFGNENFSSSFCYVSDVIDAVVKYMETDITNPLNIGSDVEINTTDIARKIIQIIGAKSKVKYTDKLLFMSPLCIPDISLARNELGWMPIVTLEKGLETAIYQLRASKGLKGVKEAVRNNEE